MMKDIVKCRKLTAVIFFIIRVWRKWKS